jgi:mannosyl-oligosaccharide alpha-1,2-mannosidase
MDSNMLGRVTVSLYYFMCKVLLSVISPFLLRCHVETYAMGHDELKPVSNQAHDPFGGWGATIADALSTMQIMELYGEFDEAVDTIVRTNFSVSSNNDISTFETIIRYLGGFLSAYELSGDRRLLDKAEEVGQVVIKAFDTKFGLPYHRWNIEKYILSLVIS